jgi:predicted RNA-binding Zn-ribbon protein involved in translation (DUF1610 family)
MWDRIKVCTECGTNLVGPPIPEERREEYGGRTHFSRLIGISNGEAVVAFRCPDCEATFHMGRTPEPVAVREVEAT